MYFCSRLSPVYFYIIFISIVHKRSYHEIYETGSPHLFFAGNFCIFCLILFFSGIFPYIVLSGSMEPSIPTGSVIFVQTREIFVQPGDVILYTGSAGNVTHRVVKDQNEVYLTKGDANSTCDPLPVKKEQIKEQRERSIHPAPSSDQVKLPKNFDYSMTAATTPAPTV